VQALVGTFIKTFQRALTIEIDAMRRRSGAGAEVRLTDARALDSSQPSARLYTFKLLESGDRLAPHTDAMLTHAAGDARVTIVAIDDNRITLASRDQIVLDAAPYTLSVTPWFLLEKLQNALLRLLDMQDPCVASALRLFGKIEVQRLPQPVRLDHRQLNESQQRAIHLCLDTDLAFIWGPPGTGKTTTLGHIVAELLAHDQRVLITSTTNAAVDQVLARLAEQPDTRPYFERGQVVRIGPAQGQTFGAGLAEVTARHSGSLREQIARLEERCARLEQHIQQCVLLGATLAATTQPLQLDLFHAGQPARAVDLSPVFSARYSRALRHLTVAQQAALVERRKRRAELLVVGYRERIAQCRHEFSAREAGVVQQARIVLTTTTTLYVNPLLEDARFDVVIVEEAGMTILPALFFCACLARHKIIAVGDPKQLPAIVQSDNDFARKYLGQNIFDVTIKDLAASDIVVMLDTQYRMHPAIGGLVSRLFYAGQVRDAESVRDRALLAAKPPYPGAPLVVVDTAGWTTCSTHQGQFSRFNRATAKLCAELAVEAARSGIASVGIITPYAEQSRLIRDLLSRFPAEASAVECRTVHRFQGSERDMIILDTVDTAPYAPGVLLAGVGPYASSGNLVNVSISRARGKLIIVADVAYFRKSAPTVPITQTLDQALLAGLYVALPQDGGVA